MHGSKFSSYRLLCSCCFCTQWHSQYNTQVACPPDLGGVCSNENCRVEGSVQTICSHVSKPSVHRISSAGGARVSFVHGYINQFDIHVVQTACRESLAFQRGLLPRALFEEHKTIIEFSRRLVSPFDIHHITRLQFS